MKKLALLAVLAFVVGCGSDKDENTTDSGTDTSTNTENDTGSDDTTVEIDGSEDDAVVVVPDSAPDGDPPPVCDETMIGKTCTQTPGGECGENALCLLTRENGGVCTCPCMPNDPNTDLVNEDTCPEVTKNTCGVIEVEQGAQGFCFQNCQPTLNQNSCTAPLICDPRSASIAYTPTPVCLFTGCDSDEQCPTMLGTPCTTTPDSCGDGKKCLRFTENGTDGLCSEPGTCDTVSGLCGKHGTDKPNATVGDPCTSDRECGEYMNCELEVDGKALLGQKDHDAACTVGSSGECCGYCGDDGKCKGTCTVHARNGYCMLAGCMYATATAYSEFACPSGSTCHKLFSNIGGFCFKTCDPANAATCRGNSGDQAGDYECRAWNNIPYTKTTGFTDDPICEFADIYSCTIFTTEPPQQADVNCSLLAGDQTANPTNMACRSIDGTVLTDKWDPAGFCLDDTTSETP